ncbi:hypothetical protein [Streptomyces sp. NPDC059209]|uniref:hypothetical protein n=1 Tax=Streptomyces sp. NPDC059209 TaxID=3346769 RepID=UPI0036A35B13
MSSWVGTDTATAARTVRDRLNRLGTRLVDYGRRSPAFADCVPRFEGRVRNCRDEPAKGSIERAETFSKG